MRIEIIDNRQFGSFYKKSLQEYGTKRSIQELVDTNIEKQEQQKREKNTG